MGHGHHISIQQEQFVVPAKGKKFAFILMAIGLVLSIIGLITTKPTGQDHSHATSASHGTEVHSTNVLAGGEHTETAKALPVGEHAEQAHVEDHNEPNKEFGPRVVYNPKTQSKFIVILSSFLVNGYFYLLITLAALFFYCVQYIANAGWSAAILRVPQAIQTFIPIPFIILFATILLGKDHIYHWAHYNHLGLTAKDAGFDKILAGKASFLNTAVLFIFPTVLVIIYFLIGRKLNKISDAEDKTTKGDTSFFKRNIKWSAGYALVYGFLISVIAWLYIMSIDAHWFSTIFGVYNFATGWVSALSVICLFILFLKQQGYLKLVTDEHIHDLGKFMFAFSIFWTYIWLSQYLLIWYAHIPEEMIYYQIRFENYKVNFFLNLVVNFVFPFIVLMTRNGKRSRYTLIIGGSVIILGHFHDVWLMVNPGLFGPGRQIGFLDFGIFALLGGILVYWVLVALTKRGLVPINHPYIEESAHHDVGV